MTDSHSNVHLNHELQDFEHASAEEICIISKDLASNKASGADKRPVELYEIGSVSLYRVLAWLFSKIFTNVFVRIDLMRVLLVLLIKNKTLNSSSS